jgi:phosphoribosylformylglycinamidine synthase
MCIKGEKGFEIKKPKQLINQFQYMFGEDQGRYIIEIEKENYKQVKEILEKNSVHYDELGVILNKDIVIDEKTKVSIDDLILSNNNWLKKYMEA